MKYGLYVFDLDGTLYRGLKPIDGAVETVGELRSRGAKIAFLTNNSGLTCRAIEDRLQEMGFEANRAEILTSGVGAAEMLASEGIATAYMVGEPGLSKTLAEHGIETVVDSQAQVVVVGICRTFDYASLDRALQQLRGGAKFVATNRDATYPIEDGKVQPGAGAIVAAIEACSGIEPVVIGKPNPYLIELLLKRTGVAASDTLVVGDRFETDVLAGQSAGCDTWLVLSGVTREAPAGQAFSENLRALL